MTLWQVLKIGGFTIYVLIACSILSCTIIIERLIHYHRKSRVRREDFMANIRREIEKGNTKQALEISSGLDIPFTNIVHAGISFSSHEEKEISNNMERQILIETTILEKFTAIVGTIGSISVYIGLFGTVLGIIRAFRDISASGGTGGISVVINGISEALVCTAAGLCVAVPAVVAYNYFIKKVDNFIKDMELCASETLDLLTSRKK